MGEQKDINKEEVQDTHLADMEKSWNDSKAVVLELLGESPAEAVEKSTSDSEEVSKADKESDKDMDYDEEDSDGDDDDDDDEDAEKSLEDSLDPDVMDVEPFLRELVQGMDRRFGEVTKAIKEVSKSVATVTTLQKATAHMFHAYGEMQKAMAETVEKIGNEPIPSSSQVRTVSKRFEKASDDEQTEREPLVLNMSKDEILLKALKLREDGKLSMRDVTKIENRVQKGIELPDHIKEIYLKEVD